jgi:hypothetical protein
LGNTDNTGQLHGSLLSRKQHDFNFKLQGSNQQHTFRFLARVQRSAPTGVLLNKIVNARCGRGAVLLKERSLLLSVFIRGKLGEPSAFICG